MRMIDAARLRELLDWRSLIDALHDMFRRGRVAPPRHLHRVAVPGAADATLMLMPGWEVGDKLGVKVSSVFPANAARGLASVNAVYALFSAATGVALAIIDGGELTARRTAATSALAADYCARPDAARLLIVGTGRIAANLMEAHTARRPIRRISIWGRTASKAEVLAEKARQHGLAAAAVDDLAAAVAEADIVSCATMSQVPLVHGAWLRPGVHLDLVGGYSPDMREADDEAVRRAQVFVDTCAGAMAEAGDIVQALRDGCLDGDEIADLFDLTRGVHGGRSRAEAITMFKSVGAAVEDLAAAALAYKRISI